MKYQTAPKLIIPFGGLLYKWIKKVPYLTRVERWHKFQGGGVVFHWGRNICDTLGIASALRPSRPLRGRCVRSAAKATDKTDEHSRCVLKAAGTCVNTSNRTWNTTMIHLSWNHSANCSLTSKSWYIATANHHSSNTSITTSTTG